MTPSEYREWMRSFIKPDGFIPPLPLPLAPSAGSLNPRFLTHIDERNHRVCTVFADPISGLPIYRVYDVDRPAAIRWERWS